MKKENPAHFDLVKEQNSRIVRNLLKREGALTVAKAAEKAGLSYPTVSALLKELAQEGQVVISPETESCGGRPGVRYELNTEYQYALVLYFDDLELKGQVYDAAGVAAGDIYTAKVSEEVEVSEMVAFVKKVKRDFSKLSAVSIGVPGAVYKTEITYLPKFAKLEGKDLARALESELQVAVFIENDINAIAFSEAGEWNDFAHIVYVEEDCCIGVGIVLQGELVEGRHGYAGELEYLCGDMKDQKATFVTSIAVLTCVLDLPDILVSGSFCTENNIQDVVQEVQARIPANRIPNIHVVNETKGKYEAGLLKRILLFWEGE